jgi:predicted nuclease of predicted toxin-antitoxin system
LKILLDENLPESLVSALENEGHEVESVNRLRLKGVANSKLYQEVAQAYDVCFTRDAGFVHNIRQEGGPATTKLLRVTLPQLSAKAFVTEFIQSFRESDRLATRMAMTGLRIPML